MQKQPKKTKHTCQCEKVTQKNIKKTTQRKTLANVQKQQNTSKNISPPKKTLANVQQTHT